MYVWISTSTRAAPEYSKNGVEGTAGYVGAWWSGSDLREPSARHVITRSYFSCFNSTTMTSMGFSPAFTSECIVPGGLAGSQ